MKQAFCILTLFALLLSNEVFSDFLFDHGPELVLVDTSGEGESEEELKENKDKVEFEFLDSKFSSFNKLAAFNLCDMLRDESAFDLELPPPEVLI